MARTKKQRPEKITGGYAAIPWVVIDSLSFMGATDKAKALLFALMRQHNGTNNGHLQLTKKWLSKQGWTCDQSNRNATNELIERGLVIQTKWGGLNAGANLYALTWYDITNYVGLDISANGYHRGAYISCALKATARRKPPIKQNQRHNNRARTGSTFEPDHQLASSTIEPEKPLLVKSSVSITENNVLLPLQHINKPKWRIVGVKGKSGVMKYRSTLLIDGKQTQQQRLNLL